MAGTALLVELPGLLHLDVLGREGLDSFGGLLLTTADVAVAGPLALRKTFLRLAREARNSALSSFVQDRGGSMGGGSMGSMPAGSLVAFSPGRGVASPASACAAASADISASPAASAISFNGAAAAPRSGAAAASAAWSVV